MRRWWRCMASSWFPRCAHKARVIRLITGFYHKVRKGDAAEGYHQSLIDITPERVRCCHGMEVFWLATVRHKSR